MSNNVISDDEGNFIRECTQLGLSSSLKLQQEKSKQRQEELKLQIELCKLNSFMDEANIKKRKLEESCLQIVSDSKVQKTIRKTEICDDVIGKILEYLHRDLELFKYLGVSKQFQRIILEKSKHLIIEFERKIFPPYQLPNVESLTFFSDFEHKEQNQFITKCVNIKHLFIERMDFKNDGPGDNTVDFKFKKPSIESIVINVSHNHFVLRDRNLFNLKKLEMWEPYAIDMDNVINNYTYTLQILSLKELRKVDITPILNLPLLCSLELEGLNENQVISILNTSKKLEILKVDIDEAPSVIGLIEPDTKSILNLKYLNVSNGYSNFTGKLWKYNFSNLKALKIDVFNDDWKFFSTNNTFSNLEIFKYESYSNESVTANLGKCKNLKNLKHLSLHFFETACLDYGIFQKQKFKHLKSLLICGCRSSFICNLAQIEDLNNLKILRVIIDNETDLINLTKSNVFAMLKYLGIRYDHAYPQEFFENLSSNFKQLVELDCGFKNYEEIELLRKYHPINLRIITINKNEMQSLGYKILSNWKEIAWKDKPIKSYIDHKLEKIESTIASQILSRDF
ncbi:predicted protein [Naegleria gruberi]|uniref:Predicted protein n=1 Tax=Naegleria gruberi TaxID=5762 RepID=D2W432_NAEGR|nr:uncharacterized protein NAEGRDRAFT_76162 [Naegleria gruberi]EFC36172.1 predicted protein [Naegleria gruberi]|eukprot:XP_002668916.1 predicted protein [Naegleria gruberi strain NEG-M]